MEVDNCASILGARNCAGGKTFFSPEKPEKGSDRYSGGEDDEYCVPAWGVSASTGNAVCVSAMVVSIAPGNDSSVCIISFEGAPHDVLHTDENGPSLGFWFMYPAMLDGRRGVVDWPIPMGEGIRSTGSPAGGYEAENVLVRGGYDDGNAGGYEDETAGYWPWYSDPGDAAAIVVSKLSST